jgi:hypothetical protein
MRVGHAKHGRAARKRTVAYHVMSGRALPARVSAKRVLLRADPGGVCPQRCGASRTIKTPASRLVPGTRDSDAAAMGFDKLTESFARSGAATDGLLPVRVLWQLSNA